MNIFDEGKTMAKKDDVSKPKDLTGSLSHCAQMINELQQFKGYSLSRIAKRCGVSPSTIRNIASGNVKTPRLPLLKKILILHCKVFGHDPKKPDDGNDKT